VQLRNSKGERFKSFQKKGGDFGAVFASTRGLNRAEKMIMRREKKSTSSCWKSNLGLILQARKRKEKLLERD